ncbi:hypothetical protein GO755_20715 [Spirosoma sp. HMF4905]|uniref:Uncharacterized protein n=1 Tax=Spirosoma arboris TaxID=2682092 RepID=A0A7K1SFJ5_9BACT|nr:hypothetical protein [Spirosoma arboris]MVM32478.1 hypothetical protein [Spirosoma arboris]
MIKPPTGTTFWMYIKQPNGYTVMHHFYWFQHRIGNHINQRHQNALGSHCIPFALCLSLLSGFLFLLAGCQRVYHDRRSIQELNQTFRINKEQSLFYTDKQHRQQSKQLTKPATAALYVQNDTLFAEFLKASLPLSDGNPATIDQSDSAYVFLVNPKPQNIPVDGKSPWFRYHFTSFDMDLVTIPFKYRLAQPGMVAQLTTNANAAVYLGLRYDQGYQRNVFYHHQQRSEIRSFSVGIGGLLGLTAATVGPFSTTSQVTDEYEGACLSYGLATIFGYRAVTLGLAVGYDRLLDSNRSLWRYHQKNWFGITIGLNLN